MTPRLLLCLILALKATAVAATPVSYSLTFVDDYFTELHTKDLEICARGDPDCYPKDFDVTEPFRSYLSPFAGLKPGTEIPLKIEQIDFDEATCQFGSYFECDGGYGYNEKLAADDSLLSFDLFDWIGDVSIAANLETGRLIFFGAAGSYAVGGCYQAAVGGLSLPAGYCDYFGYMAEFDISPGDGSRNLARITEAPLSPTMWMLLTALVSLAYFRSRRTA